MIPFFKMLAGVGALAILAACAPPPANQSTPRQPNATQMPAAPGSPPFITTMSPDVS